MSTKNNKGKLRKPPTTTIQPTHKPLSTDKVQGPPESNTSADVIASTAFGNCLN